MKLYFSFAELPGYDVLNPDTGHATGVPVVNRDKNNIYWNQLEFFTSVLTSLNTTSGWCKYEYKKL